MQITDCQFFVTAILIGCSAGLVQAAWISKLSNPFRCINSLILIRESAAAEDHSEFGFHLLLNGASKRAPQSKINLPK